MPYGGREKVNMVTSILVVSLVLQFVAIYFALRLIKVSGRSLAWSFIAAAITLMALRRGVTLGHIFGEQALQADLSAELIALLISVLMAFGIERITPIVADLRSAAKREREMGIRYRMIFENSPVSVWEEDFSGVKTFFDRLRGEGVGDIESYFNEHPDAVLQCAELTKIVAVNRAALTLHGAADKEELLAGLAATFTPESFKTFREELVSLWHGKTEMSSDAVVKTLSGEPRSVTVNYSVCPACEETLSKVYVSLIDVTEREKERQQINLLNTALNNVHEAAFLIDENARFHFVNEEACRILGYSREELLSRGVEDVDPDFPSERWPGHWLELKAQGALLFEGRHRTKDGEIFPVEISANFIEYGEQDYNLALVRDIAERKRAEAALAASERQFRSLGENLPDNIIRYDREGRAVYINPVLEKLLGTSARERIGKRVREFHPDGSYEVYAEAVDAVLAGEGDREFEFVLPGADGNPSIHQIRIVAERGENGRISGVMAISHDITEQKRAEKELLDARMLFEGIIEQSPIPMALAKPTGELFFNKACADFLHTYDDPTLVSGIKYQDMKQPWKDYDAQGNPVPHGELPLARALQGEVTKNFEMQVVRKDGSRVWEMVTAGPIYDSEDNLIAGFIAFPDITERKEAEEALRKHREHLEETVQQRTEELRQARDAADAANKAKSLFLANMSHELRTPLNAILGFSQMMHHDEGLKPMQYENLDIINRSGEHLLGLINDVLDIAKIESGKLQLDNVPFDLESMIYEVGELMRLRAEQKGLELRIERRADLPRYIMGDEMRLRQILVNLVGNAIKFTGQGWVAIRLGIKGKSLLIDVEDSGPGIELDAQEHLFDPFVQLSESAMQSGTGLGLAIVRQFVQMMKGDIRVESTPGKGALFRIELPLESVDSADIRRLDEKAHGDVVGLTPGQPVYRILIAEDQAENRLLLTRLMRDIGLEVKAVENGEACVKLFESWQPDLIWMDERMPVMDGIEATRSIRAMTGGEKVKIVAVTALAFKEQQNELMAAGMDDFVSKPYRFNDIYDCLAGQLGVTFIYSTEKEEEKEPPKTLTPDMLSVLSTTARNRFKKALKSLESERIAEEVEKIAAIDPKLYDTLRYLVDNFDYPTILEALKGVKE